MIPLTLPVGMMDKLNKIFLEKYKGWCTNGIDKQDADFLDTLFREYKFPMVVERKLLKKCEEAWIHIRLTRIDENSDEQFHCLMEFSGEKGVFIFENSD